MLIALAVAGCGSLSGGSSGSARSTVLRTLGADIAAGSAAPRGALAQCVTTALKSQSTLELHELAYAGFPPEAEARREISSLFTGCITDGHGTRRLRGDLVAAFRATATGVTATKPFLACVRAQAAAMPAARIARAYASVIVSGRRHTSLSDATVRGLGLACFSASSTQPTIRASFIAISRSRLTDYSPAARRCLDAQVAKTPTATIVAIDRAGVTSAARAQALGDAAGRAWAAACGDPTRR